MPPPVDFDAVPLMRPLVAARRLVFELTLYLAWLMRKFHNDLRLVAAAHYAGEDVVGRRDLAYRNPDVVAYVARIRTTYLREAELNQELRTPVRKEL